MDEPTLDDVARENPGWDCTRGVDQLWHAIHRGAGTRVRGEDPADLAAEIRAAELRASYTVT